MGIYTNGKIYGIRICRVNAHDILITLLEKTYTETMTHEQLREAYLFYAGLENKDDISLQIYTECSSTHDIRNKEPFRTWFRVSTDYLLDTILES
jgi:hypothetical protein